MTRRQVCRHKYPRTVDPWDPDRVRCKGCQSPAPEHIIRAIYNQTLSARARRMIRAAWAEFEDNRP